MTPYSAEGKNPTTNASDRVYAEQEDGANELTLTGDDTSGYTAAVTIALPITATYDAGTTMGGLPDGGMGGPPDGGMGPPDGGMGGAPPDGG